MRQKIRIAVAGAGQIGRRHVEAILETPEAQLAAIVDPAPGAAAYAADRGVPHFIDLDDPISRGLADAVIVATPNQLHAENSLRCIAAGLPVLIEKPVATDSEAAAAIIRAADTRGTPVLVGHHRRHNPLIQRAKAELDGGAIGNLLSFSGVTWLCKPDDYFETDWRRMPGAGPVYLNMIHDIDLVHYLCGEIDIIHAWESNAVRGNAVEETAVVSMKFRNGMLGTINVSDAIVAPWSWELTARENPSYPPTDQHCYLIGGTHGSLELPRLRLWRNRGRRSWWEPIDATHVPFGFEDPLRRQIRQFAAVVRGEEAPLVSGRDGLQALRVVEAVKQSARTGATVVIGS
ncbi:Gfo/Idh/MocA family protein [Aquibium microcysteis]|uniref:Gfo/Idh/MocA family protein n=1 Tax=Aquibium microcysteis TaxID=675281 RepID=UPI00165D09B7|nr:Gfo/Idh/MocA family oxidoreductase [Aquibium microcysteis]